MEKMTLMTQDSQTHWTAIRPFMTVHNDQDYDRLVAQMNELLDEIGANENHPMYESKEPTFLPLYKKWQINVSLRQGHHSNSGRHYIRIISAVVGMIGKAVRAVEIGIRRVGKGAVGVEGQVAVGRADIQNGRQRVSFRIAVVTQHAWGSHTQQIVLIGGVSIAHGHGRVVGGR